MAAQNYFTTTLGEAAALSLTNPDFRDINHLIDVQARLRSDDPAVGFFQPAADRGSDTAWATQVFSFREVRSISVAVSAQLRDLLDLNKSRTIALLCPSDARFLWILLGLLRANCAVLLVAPQCQPEAIAHLCRACDATLLLYDKIHEELAADAVQTEKGLEDGLRTIGISDALDNDALGLLCAADADMTQQTSTNADSSRVAYIHHTSGTSSGLPKPVPQSHNAAVCALPCIAQSNATSTFTTTPLYHGGIADVFRAWTSGAMIWLFPGGKLPVTAPNVVKALTTVSQTREKMNAPVAYFSSVPYVLQLLEKNEQGLEWLRKMDIVGVGGASLSDEIGDRLVAHGVRLISRYGSSECGFLMSSHREYDEDKAWQFLRSNVGTDYLRFEQRDDGLSELVVQSMWPHRAKTNREDGAYATSDLFQPHPRIPNAWRYHSRADSQLTLITGKKFDPEPLERALADGTHVEDAVIFGNGRPYPGVLLFRSMEAQHLADCDFIDETWTCIQALNARSQDHARIAKSMIVPMPSQLVPLEKSSKGTLLRTKIENRFAQNIERAYSQPGRDLLKTLPDEKIAEQTLEIIGATLGRSDGLSDDTDLFAFGVDSIAAMRIRGQLQGLVPAKSVLPATVVEDCGTPRKLAAYLIALRRGLASDHDAEDELRMMLELVAEYSRFIEPPELADELLAKEVAANSLETVVLTGATGTLGAHLLSMLASHPRVHKIICLVRGDDKHTAEQKLRQSAAERGLVLSDNTKARIVAVPVKLNERSLGLKEQQYFEIAREATAIMHLAWEVNFRINLRSFRDSIATVTHLSNLALASPRIVKPRFAYCSSVASVIGQGSEIFEAPSDDPKHASPLGYSRSKWVAERICTRAHEDTKLKGRVSFFRVGQLSGARNTGVWNRKEAWPMMLSTVKLTKSLPILENEPLNWLPVDIAAASFVQAVIDGSGDSSELQVLHVLNQQKQTTWMDLLGWLRGKVQFEAIPSEEWISQLEKLQVAGHEHPSFRLIGHWKDTLADPTIAARVAKGSSEAPHFVTCKSVEAAPVLAETNAIGEAYFAKIWSWIDANM